MRAWPWTASTSCLDLLRARHRASRRPGAVVRIQRALDQFHGVFAVEPVQFAPVAVRVERRGQRLAAGEDEARVAHLQQAFAQSEDGLQFAARLLGERLGRFEIGRQEDALHVVHHEQRGLLGSARSMGAGSPFPDRRTWRRSNCPTSWLPMASSTAAAWLCVSTETNAARRICWERTIQRANSAASAVLPSPPWPRTTA